MTGSGCGREAGGVPAVQDEVKLPEPRTSGPVSLEEAIHTRRSVRDCRADPWVADAPVSILVAAAYSRITRRYGQRGRQYVHMEVGHAAQNVYLQAEALGLGTTMVGAFNDKARGEARKVQATTPEPAGSRPGGGRVP